MVTRLPEIARRRVTQGALERLASLPDLPPATLPISGDAWQAAVSDVTWERYGVDLDMAHSAAVEASCGDDAAALKKSVSALATTLNSLNEDLCCLAMFRSGLSGAVASVRSSLIGEANQLIEAVCSGLAVPEVPYAKVLGTQGPDSLNGFAHGAVEDPILAAFNVSRDDATVSRIISLDRVLAAWHGQTLALQRRLEEMLPSFAGLPSELNMALRAAMALVVTDYPLQAARAARRVYELIVTAADEGSETVAEVLRDFYLGADRSAANHDQSRRSWRDATSETASTPSAAIAALQWYRQVAEGQIRPWAWNFLALTAGKAGRVPELGEIVSRLEADGSPMAMDLRAALIPTARNAAAHEDYFYDKRRGVLVGEVDLEPKDLLKAGQLGLAVMLGAEAGWTLAYAARPEFAAKCHIGVNVTPLAILEGFARAKAASNGLALRSLVYEDGIVTLVIDSVPPNKVSHLFQAIIEINLLLEEAKSTRVYVSHLDQPIINVDVEPVALAARLWDFACRNYPAIPPATFLPIVAAARLAIEEPKRSAAAVAWLGLSEALVVLDDPLANSRRGQTALMVAASRMSLIVASLKATASLPGLTSASAEIVEAHQAVDQLFRRIVELDTWPSSRALARMASRVDSACAAYPTPAILPTLDSRPIGSESALA